MTNTYNGVNMEFRMVHTNINVINLEKSLEFYEKTLGLREEKRHASEGKHIIVYLKSEAPGDGYRLELTWLANHPQPYDLADNEIHVAFEAPDIQAARELHSGLGVICYENLAGGYYFIEDPDGYWVEIVAPKENR